MAYSPTSPVTGGAQTGFTTPTYTIVADMAPDSNGKQYAVSALGGTQVGVTTHSVGSPFTANLVKPKTFAVLGKPNPATGMLPSYPKNKWKFIVRKGMLPLAGQPMQVGDIRVEMNIPAGADTADPSNVRALFSLAIGLLNQQSAGIGDTVNTGIV